MGEPGNISPGPARYNHKAGFDDKGLLEKIMSRPVPPFVSKRTSMPLPDGEQDDSLEAEDYEGRRSGERGRQGKPKGKNASSTRRKLPRVESSPADFGR